MTVVTVTPEISGIRTYVLLIGGGKLKVGVGRIPGIDKHNPGTIDQEVLIFIYINKMTFTQICDT